MEWDQEIFNRIHSHLKKIDLIGITVRKYIWWMKMIPAHKINLPSKIIIGNGVLDKIGELCEKLGFHSGNGKSKIFIVTGATTFKVAGKKLMETLEEDNYNVNYKNFAHLIYFRKFDRRLLNYFVASLLQPYQ